MANSQQNLAVFSAGIGKKNKIIHMLHRKGQKENWTDLSLLGQEPIFKAWALSKCYICVVILFLMA